MGLPKIVKDNDTIYLIQDLSDLSVYDRAKAIVNFCDKETKKLEETIDTAIVDILERNGIIIPSKQKSVLKQAFATLKGKGKKVVVKDNYAELVDLYNCLLVKKSKLFTIWLEDDTYLQCGVKIMEMKV